jgi:hypothetical protein
MLENVIGKSAMSTESIKYILEDEAFEISERQSRFLQQRGLNPDRVKFVSWL